MSGPGRIGFYKTDPGSLQVLLYNFDVNVPKLKPEHSAWINENVGVGGTVFKGQPASLRTTQLLICGLASRTGSDKLNWNLAQNRAQSAATAIAARNIRDLKPVFQFGVGEEAARLAGLKDGVEDEKWRGVMLRFDAPPIKPIPPPVPVPFRPPNLLLPRVTFAKYILKEETGKAVPTGDPADQRAEKIFRASQKATQYMFGAPPIEQKVDWRNYEDTVTKINVEIEEPGTSTDKELYKITTISFDYEWGPQPKGMRHTIDIKGKGFHSCSDDQLQEWLENPVKAYVWHKW
jgi:hypothetical protein